MGCGYINHINLGVVDHPRIRVVPVRDVETIGKLSVGAGSSRANSDHLMVGQEGKI
jgi:hypothetical protein